MLERSYLLSLTVFSKVVSMVNLKTTIDYNNILIKAQLNYIATVSVSETNSKRPVCIKFLKGTILYLHLGRHNNHILIEAGYFRNYFAV